MAQPASSVELIFRLLREHPETTRTDIASRTGLSKATVSEAVALLLDNNLVTETGKRPPGRGGRRRVILQLRPEARLVIGAEFDEHGCRAVLADLRAGPISFADRSFSSTDPEEFVAAIDSCVAELRHQATVPVLGIGIGVPGLVDESGRRVAISVPFGWRDVPFAARIESRTGLRVAIANRAKAAALGEYWQGARENLSDRSHLAYITVGAGIVAGFVINGAPYFGTVGSAGELGHTTVEPGGPLCGCGNHGCLYMYASESAIIRHVEESRERLSDDARLSQPPLPKGVALTMGDIAGALQDGHPLVVGALERAARYLGIAIANLINVMNPSHVIIGGSVAALGETVMIPLRAELQRRALWDARKDLVVAPSALGEQVGPIGGAALFLSRVDTGHILAND
jgi:predicted NBD/HSP70 family sugar kinase